MAQKESMTITLLWRGDERRACHSEKELEQARADGFRDYNPTEHTYPRWMYRGEESVVVKSAAEEKTNAAVGFTGTPTVSHSVLPDLPSPADQVSTEGPLLVQEAILANHAAQIADLVARVSELEGRSIRKQRKQAEPSDE